MFDFWENELSEEETAELIERAALAVEKKRMTTGAILALEMHKPLAGIGAQASIVFAPFLVPFFGYENVNDYSRLIKSRDNIERLLKRLESTPAQPGELGAEIGPKDMI